MLYQTMNKFWCSQVMPLTICTTKIRIVCHDSRVTTITFQNCAPQRRVGHVNNGMRFVNILMEHQYSHYTTKNRRQGMHAPISSSYLWILLTAVLWGATDPLLKHFGALALEKEKTELGEARVNSKGLLTELREFFSDWRYSLAYFCNQLGSVAFVVALSQSDLSLAVSATNGLKFAVTFVVGRFVLGEKGKMAARETVGLALVLAGVLLQMS